jgi:hypothetical protein
MTTMDDDGELIGEVDRSQVAAAQRRRWRWRWYQLGLQWRMMNDEWLGRSSSSPAKNMDHGNGAKPVEINIYGSTIDELIVDDHGHGQGGETAEQ